MDVMDLFPFASSKPKIETGRPKHTERPPIGGVEELVVQMRIVEEALFSGPNINSTLWEDCLSLLCMANVWLYGGKELKMRTRAKEMVEKRVWADLLAADWQSVLFFAWTVWRCSDPLDLTWFDVRKLLVDCHQKGLATLLTSIEALRQDDGDHGSTRSSVAAPLAEVLYAHLRLSSEMIEEVRAAWGLLEFGPRAYPPEPWYDYKQAFLTTWCSSMGYASVDNRALSWASELRVTGMNSVWPVLRRAYMSEPKETRAPLELYLALSLSIVVASPQDYRSIRSKAISTWATDVQEGPSLELKLVYALSIFPGLCDPSRPVGKRSGGPNLVLLQILLGTRDTSSPLAILRRFDKVLIPLIWSYVEKSWKGSVFKARSAFPLLVADFPPPFGKEECININMMPIIISGGPDLLPESVKRYFPMIASLRIPVKEHGNVMYLSVHESWVEPHTTQRRGGLHVESPGVIKSKVHVDQGYWGNGYSVGYTPSGGIYFGSNIAGSCAIYPDDWVLGDAMGEGGSCESLRSALGKRVLMEANEIWWMCDKAPHEAIPVARQDRYFRQFFRVVRGKISHWYSKHNTINPFVHLPPGVEVIDVDKFKEQDHGEK